MTRTRRRAVLSLAAFVASLPVAACRDRAQTSAVSEQSPPLATAPAVQPISVVPAAPVVIPAGTRLPLELRTSLSTASSQPGDVVVAVLRDDLRGEGRVLAPAGSELRGRVTTCVRAGKVKGRARLVVRFDQVSLRGRAHELSATAIDITAASSKKRDVGLVGGGVGAGALIGGLAAGRKGLGVGALLGGAAGGGAVLATRGREVELPAGTSLTVRLRRALSV